MDEEKNLKKEEDRDAKTVVSVDFSIKGCPLWVYKDFTKDINKYNDCYWAKLMDVIRKAGMYDYITSGQTYDIEEDREVEQETKPKDRYGVWTATGFNEFNEDVQNKIRNEKEMGKNDR